MTDITQIKNFIEYNQPIFDEITKADENLSNNLSDVIKELFEKYVGVPIIEPKKAPIDTVYSDFSIDKIKEEIEIQKELIELYEDPEDPDQIEAEANLLELELELENRI